MPERRLVDWAVIREEYEQTDVSDAALAQRWGFSSGTSILRKRRAEGWTRDVAAVTASLVVRAVASTAKGRKQQDEAAHTARTHAPHTHGADTANPSNAGTATDDVSATRAKSGSQRQQDVTAGGNTQSRTSGWDNSEAAKLETAQHLASIKARAIAKQLDTAEEMVSTGLLWLRELKAVACAPTAGGGVMSDYNEAVTRLGALSDKDTLNAMLKAVSGLLSEGTRIQREALGMDTPAAKPDPNAPLPETKGGSVTQLLPMLSLGVLEQLGEAARKLQTQRPSIEGRADRVGEV